MKKVFYLVLISLLFTISGCSSDNNNTAKTVNMDEQIKTNEEVLKTDNFEYKVVKSISSKEAKKQLEKDDSIILLDVRSKEEYDQIHIPGSKLIPLDELQIRAEKELSDKNTKIFVYCKSGGRSTSATELLDSLGYKYVYNLGGIKDWPYETDTETTK